jgi:hypothetical protein
MEITTMNSDSAILSKDQEVQEMHFIISGQVCIGYFNSLVHLDKKELVIFTHQLENKDFFGEYYLLYNTPS